MSDVVDGTGGALGGARRAPIRLHTRFVRNVRELGAIGVLTRRTVVAALRPPYSFGPELASQFVFGLRMAWFPMVLSSLAFTYGPAGVQAAGFLNLFGAIDRLSGLFALIVVREFAPLVCAIVMAGVVGTSMCADLGARKIREELDALMVLGIDPRASLATQDGQHEAASLEADGIDGERHALRSRSAAAAAGGRARARTPSARSRSHSRRSGQA